MRAIPQSGTKPETLVRSALRTLGLRVRNNVRGLPGSPDVANKSRRFAVFVHGCFWHGHPGCSRYTVPKTNRRQWQKKVLDNRARDRRKERELRTLGFRVVVVWECETDDDAALFTLLRVCLRDYLATGGAEQVTETETEWKSEAPLADTAQRIARKRKPARLPR